MAVKDVDFMETYTGKYVVPVKLKPQDIDIADIAHSLALTCRFRGHCSKFYSVAEHSVRVANVTLRLIARDKARRFSSTSGEFAISKKDYQTTLLALLHDAHEAYTGDELRGLKDTARREYENRVQGAVVLAFNLQGAFSEFIKQADDMLLAIEGRDLMARTDGWYLPQPPLAEIIEPHTWQEAEKMFIAKYDSLQKSIVVTK